jgi:hypothetical protein
MAMPTVTRPALCAPDGLYNQRISSPRSNRAVRRLRNSSACPRCRRVRDAKRSRTSTLRRRAVPCGHDDRPWLRLHRSLARSQAGAAVKAGMPAPESSRNDRPCLPAFALFSFGSFDLQPSLAIQAASFSLVAVSCGDNVSRPEKGRIASCKCAHELRSINSEFADDTLKVITAIVNAPGIQFTVPPVFKQIISIRPTQ